MSLCRREDRDRAEARRRVFGQMLQQYFVVLEQPIDRRFVEQVGPVLESGAEPLRGKIGAGKRQLEFRGPDVHLGRLEAKTGERPPRGDRTLHDEQHLELRCRALLPAERLGQLLEGQDVVREGLEGGASDLRQQRDEIGIVIEPAPDQHRIHKITDQAFGLRRGPARNRRPDHDVRLPAVALEEGLPGGHQHHVQGRALLGGQPFQSDEQLGRQRSDRFAARSEQGLTPRSVGGEVDHRWSADQLSSPVPEMAFERLALQFLTLPRSEVAELNRERSPLRPATASNRIVGKGQVVEQNAHRPAIHGDVMGHQNQDVLVGSDPVGVGPEQLVAVECELAPGCLAGPGQRHDLGIPFLTDVVHDPFDRAGREHSLGRDPFLQGNHGPERLVALHHGVEGALERGVVERPGDPAHQRDVVSDPALANLRLDPEQLLAERERRGTRVGPPRDRGTQAGTRGPVRQCRSEGGRRRMVEEGLDSGHGRHGAAEPAEQPHRDQRVAAVAEEIVVPPETRQVELRSHQIGDHLLERSAGWLRWRPLGGRRGRERLPVQLPVRREREAVEPDQLGRHHVGRQRGPEVLLDRREVAPIGEHEVAHQPRVARLVLADHHGAGFDLGRLGEHRLDLAELDPEPAELDLVVHPAEELESAVGPPADPVAGAVETITGPAEGIGHEPVRRELGLAAIAPRQAGPADAQFAGDADRLRFEARTQHIERGIENRAADHHRLAGLERPRGRPDRGLGRAVHVPEGSAMRRHGLDQRDGDGFAAAEHREPAVAPPAGFEQQAPRGRRGLHVGRPGRLDQRHQLRPIHRRFLGSDEDPAARHQREPQFEPGDIEGDRREGEHHVVRPEAGARGHRGEEIHQRRLGNLHPFRLPRRARRVDEVGQILRRPRGPEGRGRQGIDLGRDDIEQHRRGRRSGHGGGDTPFGHDRRNARIVEDVAKPLGRMTRIQRHIGRPQFLHGQEGHDQLGCPLQRHRHGVAGLHTVRSQVAGQPVGTVIELAIRQGSAGPEHGRLVRAHGCLVGDPRRQRSD